MLMDSEPSYYLFLLRLQRYEGVFFIYAFCNFTIISLLRSFGICLFATINENILLCWIYFSISDNIQDAYLRRNGCFFSMEIFFNIQENSYQTIIHITKTPKEWYYILHNLQTYHRKSVFFYITPTGFLIFLWFPFSTIISLLRSFGICLFATINENIPLQRFRA